MAAIGSGCHRFDSLHRVEFSCGGCRHGADCASLAWRRLSWCAYRESAEFAQLGSMRSPGSRLDCQLFSKGRIGGWEPQTPGSGPSILSAKV